MANGAVDPVVGDDRLPCRDVVREEKKVDK
jgi:hypothetical protein